ncbi:MAG TPA: isoaspartyl peptidase/L-asparaginase [Candidatus Saccharimonadales bacterium]|nr:isoaspartyl peptidase/L-asparaginase [Candidatus Saccharimonadales bacterium]
MAELDASVDIAMAVHGGAFNIAPEESEPFRLGCRAALDCGLQVLRGGGSSLDAVEAAIRVLEANDAFDAGFGSFLDEDGEVSLDAGMMDGATLATGSVAAVQGVPHPVSLARRVLESDYAVIVGPGARRFAERHGVELCDPATLVHERERARWLASGAGQVSPGWAARLFGDTVGAVARDRRGNLAAATSTGGSPGKPKGRVGDSPFVGAGVFADNRSAAVSTTGHGELIIPLVWAKEAANLVAGGLPGPEAATAAVTMLDRLDARGGMILLDPQGRIGAAWNTPAMAFAILPAGATEIVDGPRG